MERIERLRGMAKEALQEYQAAIAAGGEPSYPQWAEDILAVCAQVEAVTAPAAQVPPYVPQRATARSFVN